jgi:hypothetical protein
MVLVDVKMSDDYEDININNDNEEEEEELGVLPRHTKVVITGNNRTKSCFVGLQGWF